MKTLISMTDFVLEQKKRSFYGQIESSEILQTIYNYMEFLKQPLMLGMFVPCDEKGNVLKPETVYCMAKEGSKHFEKHKKYWEAKEKVLFKIESKIGICNNEKAIYFDGKSPQIISDFAFLTVEDIAHWNFELTESAIKQIFGNT